MDVDSGTADPLAEFHADFDHAGEVAALDPAEAVGLYRKIIFSGEF